MLHIAAPGRQPACRGRVLENAQLSGDIGWEWRAWEGTRRGEVFGEAWWLARVARHPKGRRRTRGQLARLPALPLPSWTSTAAQAGEMARPAESVYCLCLLTSYQFSPAPVSVFAARLPSEFAAFHLRLSGCSHRCGPVRFQGVVAWSALRPLFDQLYAWSPWFLLPEGRANRECQRAQITRKI